jgi:hypothetical protein
MPLTTVPLTAPPGSLGPGPRRAQTLADDLFDAGQRLRQVLARSDFKGLPEEDRKQQRRRLREEALAVEEVARLLDTGALVLTTDN